MDTTKIKMAFGNRPGKRQMVDAQCVGTKNGRGKMTCPKCGVNFWITPCGISCLPGIASAMHQASCRECFPFDYFGVPDRKSHEAIIAGVNRPFPLKSHQDFDGAWYEYYEAPKDQCPSCWHKEKEGKPEVEDVIEELSINLRKKERGMG